MTLPSVNNLLEELARQQACLLAKEEELERLRLENMLLRQKLDALARRLFGKKSEQLNEAQLHLLLQEYTAPGPALGKPSGPEALEALPPRPLAVKKRRDRSARVPEHLPVIEQILIPEPVQACPEAWRFLSEEVTEQLDYEPGRFLRRRLVRRRYVRHSDPDAAPIIAPLPGMILEGSILTPGLLAHIITSKYCDHLPLYRLESIFERRHGVWLPRQTMARWMGVAAGWLRLIYEAIGAEVLAGGYAEVDETAIRYLVPGHGKTKLGYLWACSKPGGDVIFYWNTSRAAAVLEEIIPLTFEGVIQCDGYRAYDCFVRRRKDKFAKVIILIGCIAHVRRKFYDARESAPHQVGLILKSFQELYAIEARLREQKATPELRQATRERESRPIMQGLHAMLLYLSARKSFLPQSSMGKAISYALGEWDSFETFLGDGRVEIDNNLVENAIRPTAIGKKTWLCFGAAKAGEHSAILYTIIESCRRRGIDPHAYLRDVLGRLPSMTTGQIKDVTPEAWAKAQAQLKTPAALAA